MSISIKQAINEFLLSCKVEGKIPLKVIGDPRKLNISRVDIVATIEGRKYITDEWEGPSEVKIEEVATPDLPEIPFPSTESLWKTTDSGSNWERILTSNLKLWVDGEEVQVGTLESISLSDSFATDNTLLIYECSDRPRVWISTDGGNTFTIKN
jgi:hypothetical protein